MVKVDWLMIGALYGEFLENFLPASAFPLARNGELGGPDTMQEVILLALQVMVDSPPILTRAGLALMETLGDKTSTEANAGNESPPAPEQTTW